MTTWIALFRGINVGGRNVLPMTELSSALQSLNLENVRTYIQSGNVVFSAKVIISKTLGTKIAATIEKHHGFRPHVFILSEDELMNAIESNPFPEAEAVSTPLVARRVSEGRFRNALIISPSLTQRYQNERMESFEMPVWTHFDGRLQRVHEFTAFPRTTKASGLATGQSAIIAVRRIYTQPLVVRERQQSVRILEVTF